MEQQQNNQQQALSPMQKFNRQINGVNAQAYLQEVLKEEKDAFVTNLISVVASNKDLQLCEPMSIIYAAIAATTLHLPLNPNLGYAALVPYNDSKSGKKLAQFQIMRDGWIELCHRTGLPQRIVNEPVYEGELVSKNRFTGEYVFNDGGRTSDKIIGYMAYVKLTTGFEKTVYWSAEEVEAHAKTYSQVYKKGYGLWVDNYKAMALKTVLKNLIKKYMPKSTALDKAIERDQATFDSKDLNPHYIDAPDEQEQHEALVEKNRQALRERQTTTPDLP